MSTFHESIRNALAEVDKFIESLKGEKLSKKVQASKEKVVEVIKKLREEWPALENPSSNTDLKVPENDVDQVSNESIKTKSSHGSGNAEEDDSAYSENVPEKSVKDLSSPVKTGFLEKRRKKPTLLQSAFQKRYCVIKDKVFYYFERNTDKKQAGAFFLEGYEFKEAPQYVQGKDVNKKFCFELTSPGKRPFQEKSRQDDNHLVFLVDTKGEFDSWQEAITGIPCSSDYENYEVGKPGYDYMKPDGKTEHNYMRHSSTPDENYLQPMSRTSHYYNEKTENYYNAPSDNADNTDNIYADAESPPVPSMPPPSKKPDNQNRRSSITAAPLPAVPTPDKKMDTTRRMSGSVGTPLPAVPAPSKPTETSPPKLPRREPVRLTWHPDEDYENMFYGKWDHKADNESELAFKYGEIIHIINRDLDKGGWWIGRKGDKYGLVAKMFLAPAYMPFTKM